MTEVTQIPSLKIAKIASLIADETRATILMTLMAGKAFTAGELAFFSHVSAQTASNHLKKLMQAKLITCEASGRNRFYKLASHQVAEVLESLGLLLDVNSQIPPGHKKLDKAICQARTCYDHLAGELGVKLTKGLLENNFIILSDGIFVVTSRGENFFSNLNIDIKNLKKQKRQFAKACLDFTEREYHLAGSLGAAVLDYMVLNRLVIKSNNKPRVIIITEKGRQWLRTVLKLRA